MPHTANGRHTPSTLKRDNTVQICLLTKPSDGLTAVCRRLAKIRRDMDETIQKGRLKNKFQTGLPFISVRYGDTDRVSI